jgi:HPr kinase/phosphorylase
VKKITVAELFRSKEQSLGLELLTPQCTLQREIESATLSSPGLVLAGFRDRFLRGRLQVLGETEVRFLFALDQEKQKESLEALLSLEIPALFVTKQLDVPRRCWSWRHSTASRSCGRRSRRQSSTAGCSRTWRSVRATDVTMHGSLADVYGVGCCSSAAAASARASASWIWSRAGHRLVADDLVIVTQRGNDVLLGRGHELQQHHMEIRGIGIVDIKALFGIRSIRQQKRIEVVVQLVDWDDGAQYDRTGLQTEEVEMLGVSLPKVMIPLNAGKNITVISEVVAMNHLLKYSGVHSAEQFNQRLMDSMQPVRAYLEEDYE